MLSVKERYLKDPNQFKRREQTLGIDFSSQKTAVVCLITNFGNPVGLTELAEEYNCSKSSPMYQKLGFITVGQLRNWSFQGQVPVEYCFRLGMFLDINPLIFNYELVSLCSLKNEKWKILIQDCYALTPEQKQIILAKPEYPKENI